MTVQELRDKLKSFSPSAIVQVEYLEYSMGSEETGMMSETEWADITGINDLDGRVIIVA